MGHLVQVRREKKDMYFGSLLMGFESIMNFTKRMSGLLNLIAFIVSNNLIGVKKYIY